MRQFEECKSLENLLAKKLKIRVALYIEIPTDFQASANKNKESSYRRSVYCWIYFILSSENVELVSMKKHLSFSPKFHDRVSYYLKPTLS